MATDTPQDSKLMASDIPVDSSEGDLMATDENEGKELEEIERAFKDEDYNVQYFGFNPVHLLNGMHNVFAECTQEAITQLNQKIHSTFVDEVCEAELQEMTQKVARDANNRLDSKFERAEMYLLKNVLMVPSSVVLAEDRVQVDHPCSEEDMAHLDAQIQEAEDRIIAVKYANSRLESHLSEVQKLRGQCGDTAESIDKLLVKVSTSAKQLHEQMVDQRTITSQFQQVEGHRF